MEHKEYKRIVPEAETAVLFIHGIVGTPNHFKDFLPLVPKEFSVYNILLDGHGGKTEDFSKTSMKKWENQVDFTVSDLLKTHEKIIIVAHSLGTLLAIEQAVKERRIEKLFLLAVPIKLFVKPVALFSAFRIYLGKVPESNEKLVAMKNCCGIELSKNLLKYLGWIPRFLELFGKISETRKIIGNLKKDCMIFQSFGDELVSKKSIKYLEEKTFASINVLEKSGHYYYEKNDFDYLLGELRKFICEK
ncbi:MAG: alpha/beta fold hydrolase [Oscillospiraceae bacterium]|nr:alpha/beta fold hydrolase [Oscillospiraceae bacterium]